jgi:Acetoacetate decarboxylase (ADC)
MNDIVIKHYPPPWNLMGEGFILPFFANKDRAIHNSFISEKDKPNYLGGIGAIMLVNYESSDVGPYHELLFIPGDFQFGKKKYKKITKIYVSSELSVREGILNWGIPKEYADFDWVTKGWKTKIIVSKNKSVFAEFQISRHGFSFPITTSVLPFILNQESIECYLQTKLDGKGSGKIARLENFHSNQSMFPNLSSIISLQLPSIAVNPFRLTFPIPKRVPFENN